MTDRLAEVAEGSCGASTEGAHALVEVLSRQGLTVATAESLTAGLVSSGIADVPGASAVLRGGAVTYATECKAQVLDVPADLLAERGAVDPDVAIAMARGTRRLFGADIGVATTGVAGPAEQDGKSVGTCYVAVALRESSKQSERCTVKGLHLVGDRARIRTQAAAAAWALVLESV